MRRISWRIIVDIINPESLCTAQSSLHATRNAWCFQSLFSCRTACFPSAAVFLDTSSVNIPPRQTHPLLRDHLLFCVHYSTAPLSLPLEQNIPECPRLLHWRSRTVTVPSLLLYKEWCICVFQPDHAKVTASLVKAYSTLSHSDGWSLVVIGLYTTSINCDFTT
jgi:hypothetical protein